MTGTVGSFRPSSAPVPESKHPYRYHSGIDHKKRYYEADSIVDEDVPDELVHVLSDNLFVKYNGLLDDSGGDDSKHDGGGRMMKKSSTDPLMVSRTIDHGADVDEPDQTAHDMVNALHNSNKIDSNHDDKDDDHDVDDDGDEDDYIKYRLKSDHFKDLYRPKTAPELLTPGVALTGIIQHKSSSSSSSSRLRPMSKVKSYLESAMLYDSFHLRNFEKAVVDAKKPSSLHHTHVCNVRLPLSSPTKPSISTNTASSTILSTIKEDRTQVASTHPVVITDVWAGHKTPIDIDIDDSNDFTPERLRIKRSQPDFSPEKLRKLYPSKVASKLIQAINSSNNRSVEKEVLKLNTSYNSHGLVTTIPPPNLAQSTLIATAKPTDEKAIGDNEATAIQEAPPDNAKDDKKQVSIRDILNDKDLYRRQPLYPYISLNAARATRQWESKRTTAEALLENYQNSVPISTTLSNDKKTVEKPSKMKRKRKKTRMRTDGTVVGSQSSPEAIEIVVSSGNHHPSNPVTMECIEVPISTTTTTSAIAIKNIPTSCSSIGVTILETKHPNDNVESMSISSNIVGEVGSTITPSAVVVSPIVQAIQSDEERREKSIVYNTILPLSSNEQHGNSLAAIITAWNVQDDASNSIISDTSSLHDEFELIWSTLIDGNGDGKDVTVTTTYIGGGDDVKMEGTADKKDDTAKTRPDISFTAGTVLSPTAAPDTIRMNTVAEDSFHPHEKHTKHEEPIDMGDVIAIPSSMDELVHVKSSNQSYAIRSSH